jgi:tetratricopeptide (TPR) repeat protein
MPFCWLGQHCGSGRGSETLGGAELRAEGESMNYCLRLVLAVSFVALFTGELCFAQSSQSKEKLLEQARQAYIAGKFADAERDFRELVKRDPADIDAQAYLGHALFRQQKYADAVVPYEKARELEASGSKLPSDQHRVLIDQLAMAYGISGDLNKTHALLESAIRNDPEYPLNYYNLACAYAEEGDKGKALTNLSLAFQHKDHVLKGEQMPDPRTDSSFQKYVQDVDFTKLMTKLGYK